MLAGHVCTRRRPWDLRLFRLGLQQRCFPDVNSDTGFIDPRAAACLRPTRWQWPSPVVVTVQRLSTHHLIQGVRLRVPDSRKGRRKNSPTEKNTDSARRRTLGYKVV